MSCSKIFSGDLPELTYEVIKYHQNDYSTLHSCILVNRLWCRLTIPLLWENPFSIPRNKYHVITFYLINDIYLNDDVKTELNRYKINKNLLFSNTLFNYPSFLKYLNTYNFILSVELWLKFHSISRINSINRLNIYAALLTIFFENEVNLHTLEIDDTRNAYSIFINDILKLILQNTNFIHNIRNLEFYSINGSQCTIIENHILQIIHSRQNLKKILINDNYLSLFKSLLSSNIYNCSNTLNTIIFHRVDFKEIINLDKIVEQLNVLESIHIINCSSLNNNFTQQIINLTKSFKLKSLFIGEIPQIESLDLLLQKSCNYLENFRFDSSYEVSQIFIEQLFELIIKYCNNIKLVSFDFYRNGSQFTYQKLYLIENIKLNLNYLSICIADGDFGTECSSIILQNLGQILPPKLKYLYLKLYYIETRDFEVFLKNSQNTFIKKLLIHYYNDDQNILPSIKEYIMEKKRVEYLAIKKFNSKKTEELFYLRDEVKRFGLYNIKVQSFNRLRINSYNYIVRTID